MSIDDSGVDELLEEAAKFAAVHGLTCETVPVNLFGFGTITTLFRTPQGGWWCTLQSLAEPTGVSYDDLLRDFYQERDELSEDVGSFAFRHQGRPLEIDVVSHHFAMRVLAGRSPWSKEFLDNTSSLMRHAMLRSGLADVMGPVYRIGADGIAVQVDETFAEVIREGLPPEEDAADRAFAGPTAAIDAAH